MAGLAFICKACGGMTVKGADGKTTTYIWDYAKDKAVPELEYNAERPKASEKAKAELLTEQAKQMGLEL